LAEKGLRMIFVLIKKSKIKISSGCPKFAMTKTEKKYIEIMRKKSGQERLKIAMDLRRLALKLAKEGIKNQNPKISSRELKAYLQERIYGFSFPFKDNSQKTK
jgi:hypothetical protein